MYRGTTTRLRLRTGLLDLRIGDADFLGDLERFPKPLAAPSPLKDFSFPRLLILLSLSSLLLGGLSLSNLSLRLPLGRPVKSKYGFYYPIRPNGIPHSYQLDQSISILRVVGWNFFTFIQNLIEHCQQTVENLIRRCILQCLHCFFLCTTKRKQNLYRLPFNP